AAALCVAGAGGHHHGQLRCGETDPRAQRPAAAGLRGLSPRTAERLRHQHAGDDHFADAGNRFGGCQRGPSQPVDPWVERAGRAGTDRHHQTPLRAAADGGIPMLQTVIIICLGMISLAMLLNVLRLFKGPDMPDRILALDTLYINSIALIVLMGLLLRSNLYFEAALLIAVMGFVGTVAVAKYLLRGDIIE